MKKYITKSKLFGYKIGLLNDNLYVAVPKKYLDQPVEIICEGDSKIVTSDDSVHEITHDDKFNRGLSYTLCYFLWKEFPTE